MWGCHRHVGLQLLVPLMDMQKRVLRVACVQMGGGAVMHVALVVRALA